MSDMTHVFLVTYASGPDCDAECADILNAGDVFRTLEGAKAGGEMLMREHLDVEGSDDDMTFEWVQSKSNPDQWFLVLEYEASCVIRCVALGA